MCHCSLDDEFKTSLSPYIERHDKLREEFETASDTVHSVQHPQTVARGRTTTTAWTWFAMLRL